MSMFLKGIFEWSLYWKIIALIAYFTPAVFDLYTRGLYLEGWAIKITLILTAIGLFVYWIRDAQRRQTDKFETGNALEYEKKKEAEFLHIIKENPEFQTMCYECIFFNQQRLSCNVNARLKKNPRKIKPFRKFEYCLYWRGIKGFTLQSLTPFEKYIFSKD